MITDYFMITEKSNRLQVIMITDYDYPISGMDRWADVKFCEKIRLKCKKGPFTTEAETTHVKMPRAGPKRPVTITV